jgi:hypothetical protein
MTVDLYKIQLPCPCKSEIFIQDNTLKVVCKICNVETEINLPTKYRRNLVHYLLPNIQKDKVA